MQVNNTIRYPILRATALLLVLAICFSVSGQQIKNTTNPRVKEATGKAKVDELNELAKSYRNTDRKKSLSYAKQASKLAAQINDRPGLALAYKNIGNAFIFQAEYDSAQRYYELSLPLFEEDGDLSGVSACLNNLGVICSETGRYDQAIEYLNRSVEADKKLGDEEGVSNTVNNIASIYKYLGKYSSAIRLLKEHIPVDRRLKNNSGLMEKLNALGVLYVALNEPSKGRGYYAEALQLAENDSNDYIRSLVLANIGNSYIVEEEYASAMPYLTDALILSEEINDPENEANTLTNLAEINRIRGNFITANEQLMRVLKINEDVGDRRTIAATLTCIGNNLMSRKEYDKAKGYYHQSLLIADSINAAPEVLDNYTGLIKLHSVMAQFTVADSLQHLYSELYYQFRKDSDSANYNIKPVIPEQPADSGNPDMPELKWIIAFIIMILLLIISTAGFRLKKK